MGLTISARLVEAMKGKIWVESELGTGSAFRFTVQLRVSDSLPSEPTELPQLTNYPVLVIDDNATNRTILNEMLQCWGMQVHTVESGQQALDYLEPLAAQAKTLPLVLSDVHMPEMDGFMLAEQLRKTPSLKEAVLILLTSGGPSR